MHFLHVISHYLPASRFGGPQHVAHGLGKALVGLGHQVSVCTTNLRDEVSNLDVPTDRPVPLDGVSVYYAPTQGCRYWGYAPGLARQVKRLLPTVDVVLVHFHYQYANWVGARLARRFRRPYVTFAHGSFRHAAITSRGWLRKSIYLALMERANLRDATLLIYNATEERDGSRYAARGIVLPNGIDPANFQQRPPRGAFRARFGLPADSTVLLFLGRLDYSRKGLDLLLPAFAGVSASHPHVRLVLAGPDERGGRQRVERQLDRLRIRERVICTGMLAGREKIEALVDADAFVLPSRSEGLSISLLEALYVGLPVLISDQVGLHQQVRKLHAGIVVTPSVEHITEGLRAITDADTLHTMRHRATDWIERMHAWPAIAASLVTAVDERLRSRRGRQPATSSSLA